MKKDEFCRNMRKINGSLEDILTSMICTFSDGQRDNANKIYNSYACKMLGILARYDAGFMKKDRMLQDVRELPDVASMVAGIVIDAGDPLALYEKTMYGIVAGIYETEMSIVDGYAG